MHLLYIAFQIPGPYSPVNRIIRLGVVPGRTIVFPAADDEPIIRDSVLPRLPSETGTYWQYYQRYHVPG